EFLDLPLRYMSYEQGGVSVNGFRYGSFAYLSDIKKYPLTIFEDLEGVKILVLSALRETPSQMHLSFEEAIAFARKIKPREVYFTHISHETDHEQVQKMLPKGFALAYDGLFLEL
ncbi:MAG: MBL fold metallo-hydrolase, partial [Chlamydiales bacterium]